MGRAGTLDAPPPLDVPPSRRIFGLETEFGLHLAGSGARKVTPEELASHLFHSVVQWGRSSNVFLTNASRLYVDVGAHPEYATAECDSLADLIASDKAGERIVQDLVPTAQERLATAGIEGRIHLYKNNTDSAGNSYGCHENYLVRRRADFASFASTLLPFLVTRQIVTGAGAITRGEGGRRFSFSARADHMWEGMSSSTTRSRPMINTRDEPHANPEMYRRMHVIVGDSSIAQPTVFLKVGTTDLILRLMELRVPLPDLTLESEMRAIRDVAHDLTGETTVTLADGREMTAVEIQQVYLDTVRGHVGGAIERTDEVDALLDLWQRGIDAVREQRPELVATELDWAVKLTLIERYREKLATTLSDPRLARLELAYHDISPETGLAARMERDGLIATVVDDDAIVSAMTEPPSTTRAALRGRFISAARGAGRDFSADWAHVKLAGDGRTVTLKDPFRNTDSRVDTLVEEIEAAS